MALTKVGKEGITGVSNASDATAITIDSSEKVGIGTSTMTRFFNLYDTTADAQTAYFKSTNASGGAGLIAYNNTGQAATFQLNGASNTAYGGANSLNIGSVTNNPVVFIENNAEKMRITGGNVLVGNTTNIAANAKIFAKGSGVGVAVGYGTGSAEYRHMYMNSGDGALYFFGTANYANLSTTGAWTNASDRRIKKNIVDIKYGLEDVLKIQPRSYQMKEVSGDYIGLIAQEVEEIIPEVVSGDPEKQLTLDYGSLVAVAFKAIQEQQAIIEALEARITTLEAK